MKFLNKDFQLVTPIDGISVDVVNVPDDFHTLLYAPKTGYKYQWIDFKKAEFEEVKIEEPQQPFDVEFDLVDSYRRYLYSQGVDPLIKEREIKLSQAEILESEGNIAEAENKRQEAKDYQIRALQLREKIQKENPYPINPDA